MKRLSIFFAMLLFIGGIFHVNAQDMVVLTEANATEERVSEVLPATIKYQSFAHFNTLSDDSNGGGSFTPSVRFALGVIFPGFIINSKYEVYWWKQEENRYVLDYSGTSTMFNWFHPTLDVRFLFSSGSGLHLGFGANLSIAVFGVFNSSDLVWGRGFGDFLTGGTLAPYVIIGYNNFILQLGYDFVFNALYFSPAFMIGENFIIGLPMSLFGNNQFGIMSINNTPRWRANPPEQYFIGRYFQVGLSLQYVFGRR